MSASSTADKLSFQVHTFEAAGYETVWTLQKELVERRLCGEAPDTLLMGEHSPVITLGRGSHVQNLHQRLIGPDLPVVETERGGDVTYHGPGQLVVYPVFQLSGGQRDLHAFLRRLEEVIILTLADFGLQGERNPGWTGVWVRDAATDRLLKIASIGVAVKRWVTYHGLALNVCTDLAAFRAINPCGLDSAVMTSMQALLDSSVTVTEVRPAMAAAFEHVFAAWPAVMTTSAASG